MNDYSPEDLILYLYRETPAATTAAIEEALKSDWTLREKLAVIKTSMERLDAITVTPRTEIILDILRHARKGEKVNSSN
jgi:hypothetical protein